MLISSGEQGKIAFHRFIKGIFQYFFAQKKLKLEIITL